MASNTISNPVSKFLSEHYNFQDHSALPKVLTLIPMIGPIIQFMKELSIWNKLSNLILLSEREKEIELINLKNEYKIIGIARDALTLIAVAVVAAVFDILNPIGAFISVALCCITIGQSAWSVNENQKFIQKIKNPQKAFHLIYVQ